MNSTPVILLALARVSPSVTDVEPQPKQISHLSSVTLICCAVSNLVTLNMADSFHLIIFYYLDKSLHSLNENM